MPLLGFGCSSGLNTPTSPPVEDLPSPTLGVQIPASPYLPTQTPFDEDDPYLIQLQSRRFVPPADIQSGVDWLETINLPRVHVLLQLYGIPGSEAKTKLGEIGIQLLDYIPSHTWFASIPKEIQVTKTISSIIRWFGPLLPEDKMSKELNEGSIGEWAKRNGNRVVIDVSFFEDVTLEEGELIVVRFNGEVVDKIRRSNELTVEVPLNTIPLLAEEDWVQWLDLIPPPPTTD
jgi:hypothetical protein